VLLVPKRSNEFQEVVYIIQTHLSDDAVVRESEELLDLQTGAKREVDVCVHSTVAGYDVIVSVECRDHRRPQSVGWVDEMHTKHQRLPTNLLVLASSSGFTKEALAVAEKYGIETVVPGSIDQKFGADVTRRLDALWIKGVSATVQRVVATVEPSDGLPEQRVVLLPDNLLFSSDGQELTSALDLASTILKKADFRDSMRDATGEEKSFYLELDAARLREETSVEMFLRKEDVPEPFLRRVTRLEVSGPVIVHVARMPLKHGEIRGSAYSYGTAVTGEHDVLFVETNPGITGSQEPGKGTIRIRPRKK
jgi:hypothetical protein